MTGLSNVVADTMVSVQQKVLWGSGMKPLYLVGGMVTIMLLFWTFVMHAGHKHAGPS